MAPWAWLVLAGLGVMVALLGVVLLVVVLRARERAVVVGEGQRVLRGEAERARTQLNDLAQQLSVVRSEGREQAERARADVVGAQLKQSETLQQQMQAFGDGMLQRLEGVRSALDERLSGMDGAVRQQLGGQGKVILDVKSQLGGLAEAARSIETLGRDIANLQESLKAPKLRGNLGELLLEEALGEVLPREAFETQFRMLGKEAGTAVVVDAVIRLKDRLVPIDSKFPLEAFQRLCDGEKRLVAVRGVGNVASERRGAAVEQTAGADVARPNASRAAGAAGADTADVGGFGRSVDAATVGLGEADEAFLVRRQGQLEKEFSDVVKKHVDAIASKYVRPELGTYDFALMYLPAESVYYEAVVGRDATYDRLGIVSYAATRKVILVSPNTLYAYLLTVAHGLKGMRLEQRAGVLRDQLLGFHKKFDTFITAFEKIGRNVGLAQRNFDDAAKRAEKLQGQVGKITDLAASLDDEPDAVAGGAQQLALDSGEPRSEAVVG